jgi:hypothetical protein
MHQSGVASMEAGMQQPPAKKPKKSVSDFFKKKDSPVPKPVRNFRALKRALTDARERAITILVERWPAAHPSFTQKVLPDGAVPQQAAHYGCGGLWMAIVDLWAGMSRPMERMSCSCMESEVCSIGIM